MLGKLIDFLQLGFVAFTTIGYGDYTPTTPAGRSVFIVWAILGVGTMTILISSAQFCGITFLFYLTAIPHPLFLSCPRGVCLQIQGLNTHKDIQ